MSSSGAELSFESSASRQSQIPLASAALLLVGLIFFLFKTDSGIFSNAGFMPHGHCYLWSTPLVWTMVSTDVLIGFAYVLISICLYLLVRRINLPFSKMFLAFGVFIGACGATHFIKVYNLWVSNYWASAYLNVLTALASLITAVLLYRLLPHAVRFANGARLSEERRFQLEIANQELTQQRQTLTELNRELEAFSFSVSHDLRAPLRGIDGFGQALLEDYSSHLDPEAKRYLGFIREGTQKMSRIIEDILNLSRLSRAEMHVELIDLTDLARTIVADLRRADPHRQVEVMITNDLHVQGDLGLLSIALENLLSNAWKFSQKQATPSIQFGMQESAQGPVYFVKDNGAGFDMAYIEKLFAVFQRLHTEAEFSGTGIGLATVKRVIHRHGGMIWAEAYVGKGATFYFTLGSIKN